MASRKQLLRPRSHVFPPFYACYLLRSIQTPLSKATYIGSTPNPPRRIRQHNGELKQGAWKTRSRRPWIMAMIVHGFPSRLAALQFEWAWQHPHKSRHLRDSNGLAFFESRRPKHLKANIQLVYQMIFTHPYNTWPLHVKLFSDEAVAAWTSATQNSAPMPPGFTCSIEIEGVDGKSGKVGSGRREPINIKDEQFTSSYLAKNTALLASNRLLHCSICKEELTNYTTDALSTALCPNSSCTAISHITCLSKKFLASDSSSTALIPRGGTCTSCNTYTLWGDIIRGSYRRMTGGTPIEIEEEEDLPNLSEDEPYASDSEPNSDSPSPTKKVSKQKTKATATKTRKPRREARKLTFSSEGEFFDFDGVDSVSSTNETPRRGGRPQSVSSPTAIPMRQREAPISQTDTTQHLTFRQSIRVSSEGEPFDSDSASLDDTSLERSKHLPFVAPPVASLQIDHFPVSPRKRGRPRKVPSVPTSPPRTTKRAASEKSKLGSKDYSTAASHTVVSDSSGGETFDFDAIGPGSSEDDLMVPSPGPSNVGTMRGLRSKFPGRLGSMTRTKTQPSNRDLRGQEIEFVDTTDLIRVTSSMSISSPSPTREPPRYVEISD